MTSTLANEANVKSGSMQIISWTWKTLQAAYQKPLFNPRLCWQSRPTAVEAKKPHSPFPTVLGSYGMGLHPTPGQGEWRRGVWGWRDLLKIMLPWKKWQAPPSRLQWTPCLRCRGCGTISVAMSGRPRQPKRSRPQAWHRCMARTPILCNFLFCEKSKALIFKPNTQALLLAAKASYQNTKVTVLRGKGKGEWGEGRRGEKEQWLPLISTYCIPGHLIHIISFTWENTPLK